MAASDTDLDLVSRETLEARLDQVRAAVADPAAGVFGPRTTLWEINKHSISFLGAGRAALLQLSHPWVAQAIEDHSNTRHDPVGRFQRTFFHVFRMVYGDLETALRAARSVHRIHARVEGKLPNAAGRFEAGSRYAASDPDALFWVHATLWDTSILCYEAVVRPLELEEKRRYYQDTKHFAGLFGIPEEVIPTDWEAFQSYMQRQLRGDTLHVTSSAAEMTRFLLRPPFPGSGPIARRYAETTAWLLPEHLADAFGLDRGGDAGRRRLDVLFRRLHSLWPHLPRRLRYLPAYVDARRRLSGRTDRDWVGEILSRLLVGRAGPPRAL